MYFGIASNDDKQQISWERKVRPRHEGGLPS
jgi:hypothetical protein